jgi:hypothetical protein
MISPASACRHVVAWCLSHPGQKLHIELRQGYLFGPAVVEWAKGAGLEVEAGVRRVRWDERGTPGWYVWKEGGGDVC